MPYPNEHAARVKEPGLFDSASFRSKDLKNGVRIILGKLKGEDTMTAQAYRFSTEQFTEEEARKWLKDHKISYIKFEPAKKGESMEEKTLQHVGVLGMRWGHRSGGSSGVRVGKPKGMSNKEFDKEYAKEIGESNKRKTSREAARKKAIELADQLSEIRKSRPIGTKFSDWILSGGNSGKLHSEAHGTSTVAKKGSELSNKLQEFRKQRTAGQKIVDYFMTPRYSTRTFSEMEPSKKKKTVALTAAAMGVIGLTTLRSY